MDPTVQFGTPPHPSKSSGSHLVGGVYPIRSRSKPQNYGDLQKAEVEDAEDEDAGLRNERDFKQKQVGLPRTLPYSLLLTPIGLQHASNALPRVFVHRSHLR